MYEIGTVVSYGTAGVCRITGKDTKKIGDMVIECLTLKPAFNESLTISVPTGSAVAMSKMRGLLDREAVLALIHSMPQAEDDYSTDPAVRREFYNECLRSGDRSQMVRMLKAIRRCKADRAAQGKHLSAFDETAMREAETVLYTEFAFVLGMLPGEVPAFLERELAVQA